MSIYGTMTKNYARQVLPSLTASSVLATFFKEAPIGSSRAGALTVPITTAVTLQTLADGTLLANNAAQTLVDLTAWRAGHTLSLFMDMLDQATPERDAAETQAFIDASANKMIFELLDDLVNGTPSTSKTWPVGQIDAAADGTAQEVFTTLQTLNQAIEGVRALTQGNGGKLIIISNSTVRANIATCAGSDFALAPEQSGRLMDSYRGIPWVVADTSISGWGTGAAKASVFVVHTDCEAVAWADVFIPHAELAYVHDGTFKKNWLCGAFMGLLQASHYAEILNPSA